MKASFSTPLFSPQVAKGGFHKKRDVDVELAFGEVEKDTVSASSADLRVERRRCPGRAFRASSINRRPLFGPRSYAVKRRRRRRSRPFHVPRPRRRAFRALVTRHRAGTPRRARPAPFRWRHLRTSGGRKVREGEDMLSPSKSLFLYRPSCRCCPSPPRRPAPALSRPTFRGCNKGVQPRICPRGPL